jgi:23S rRNA (cytosine1962-C5)-methyltransferase
VNRYGGGRPRREGRERPYAPGQEPVVRLKSSPRNPHPWHWKGRVTGPRNCPGGVVVRIEGPDGQPLGRGLYHPHVTLALRVLTRDPNEEIDAAFFERRFRQARALREDSLRIPEVSNSYRLIHAESDGISGMMVDVFGEVIRVDAFSAGIARLEAPIRAGLEAVFPGKSVVFRGDARSEDLEGFRVDPRQEDPDSCKVEEHGVRFHVDLRAGHKTGFFLDQRDNRRDLAQIAKGRRVLDVCTYTGGFALHAAAGGAASVTGVDLDEKAIATAKRNAKLNQVKTRFVQADGFHYLRQLAEQGERPEVLILDPPKFARDRNEKDEGMRRYRDLNRLGLEAMADEGLLLTCSCSGVVREEDLLDALRNAAARANKELTVFRFSGAAPDHPVALHAPETRYLKAIWARVRKL